MTTETNPIKRSKELAPLSREHHEGLLFVWKIRQGIRNGIATYRIADYCGWFWSTHLKNHIAIEEKVLPQVLSVEHPMMQKMLSEHEAIKEQITALQNYSSYPAFEHLARVIEYHIRFEERQLFKLVEQLAASGQLSELEKAHNEKQQASEWADEFWLYKKPVTISPQSLN
jgi:hemerythrin-like domain-containing protein